jgi:flavin reductase (DIM6/NTAB) family NADH-FMN oxidoreductase RutF
MPKVNKQNIENMYKQYQQYPRLAVIITAHHEGRDNAMSVSWHCPLASNPPYYGVSIAAKRFTYKLIAASKEFGVNFIPFEKAELIASVGRVSGADVDKFKRFNIEKDQSIRTNVPILKDAYAAYECQLVDDRDYGDHRLIVGKILSLHWNTDFFDENDLLDLSRMNPTIYLGKDRYLTVSKGSVRLLDPAALGLSK